MNYTSRIMAACLVSVVLAGCGPPKPAEEVSVNSGHDPNDQRTMAFVSWLKRKGVTLEYAKQPEDGGPWRVTQPKVSAEYEVVFSIRAFPSGASEKQMRDALDVNLAYMLNAKAHLAMSYAGYQGRHPEAKLPKSDDELPKVGGLPVSKAVENWFKEYKAR